MKLYRYIPFETFADIVINNRLSLVSPLLWEDSYEGWFWKSLIESTKKEVAIPIKKAVNSIFALCWSKNCDSAALWSIYSYNQKAIMIETSDDILSNIPKITLKEMNYTNDAHLTIDEMIDLLIHPSRDNLFLPFTKKRKEFAHENEVRIFATKPNPDGIAKSISIPINNLPMLIQNVIVHPFAPDWYIDIVKEFCKKFNVPFSGKSSLYTIDNTKLQVIETEKNSK